MPATEPIGRTLLRRPTWPALGTRPLLVGVLGGALLLIGMAGPTLAADPTPTPAASPTADPTPTPTPAATPDATPTPTPDPTASPAPTPTPDPTPTTAPDPTPVPPAPDPTPVPVAPAALDLYVTSGFRYQD